MGQSRTGVFGSFEEFEREYMPERHAARKVVSEWSAEQLAADIAAESLQGVAGALADTSGQ